MDRNCIRDAQKFGALLAFNLAPSPSLHPLFSLMQMFLLSNIPGFESIDMHCIFCKKFSELQTNFSSNNKIWRKTIQQDIVLIEVNIHWVHSCIPYIIEWTRIDILVNSNSPQPHETDDSFLKREN